MNIHSDTMTAGARRMHDMPRHAATLSLRGSQTIMSMRQPYNGMSWRFGSQRKVYTVAAITRCCWPPT